MDRRIKWHEDAIDGLAQYEERLERLHNHAFHFLVVERTQHRSADDSPPRAEDLPRKVRVPATLWSDLRVAEDRARAALRLADIFTEGRTRLECSVALRTQVNMVADQWMDISPEPEVAWTDLKIKAAAAANVRRGLQDSLKLVLELDGLLATILGAKYRKWRAIRQIKRLQAEISARAS